jgi:hypothetical protein
MTVTTDQLRRMLSLWSKGWSSQFVRIAISILIGCPEILVIGKALDPHRFQGISKTVNSDDMAGDNIVELTGLTSPWNTFAIWDLTKLAKVICSTYDGL